MRIVTVSAHYPPNFVSGGTLQPQRLARALAARGHEVHVVAGWLGDREPLEQWSEVDEAGVHVHWIVTTPWTSWDDDRNWHNPAVTARFRDVLDDVRPDVVHLHSLQSLGAGLVPAAAAAGARVVVTMHDFWWLCARQFLVDTADRPCSLVVGAGACACQRGEAERDHRIRSLQTLLAPADVVLAPSRAAAAVLEANGVAPGRIEVDENGLPPDQLARMADRARPTDRARSAGAPHEPVRFLYAGGPNPMKGAAVLVDALRRVGAPGRWRMTAYGLAPFLAEAHDDLGALSVDVVEPFAPSELGDVLAAHDVLVLPSVMRETHSLLTREALLAGLPVLCTDTLGPEEVVDDGRNGLVVPAADPVALAGALRRLAEDHDLLATLRTGAQAGVAVRALDDQVDALEERFARLLADPPERRRGPRVRSVVFVCGIQGAPLRYRARLPAEALGLLGVRSEVLHYRDPTLLDRCGRADVVVLYRVPATAQVLELVGALQAMGIPCAFDVDDLIFDPDVRDEIPALRLLPPDEAALWLDGVRRYRTTLEACDAYIGSTQMLVDQAAALTGLPAHRFDNGVGMALARISDIALRQPRRPGPLRIGYLSGTTTHDEDWFFVEPAVREVLARHPDVELWLGGHLPPTPALDELGPRVVRLPFLPWRELPTVLRDLDVNLAPLAPGSRFNEAKSAIKWLEAALVATPTVASPTGPFREAIGDDDAGLLAGDVDEWERCLDHLVTDEVARSRLGARARRAALLGWSPAQQGRRYAAILDEVLAAGPRGRTSTWEPVAPDEPPTAEVLEPYDEPPAPMPVAGLSPTPSLPPGTTLVGGRAASCVTQARRLRSLVLRGRASVRAEGIAPTARKGVRALRARLDARRSAPTG